MVAAGLFVTALLVAVSSATSIHRRQGVRVISSCTTPNDVALTFDDGPYIYNQDVINTLNAAGAKGTFFFNGNNYACIYAQDSAARVLSAYNSGHQIASHTWSHADLTTLSADQVTSEMQRVEAALQQIAGVVPAFMRPPYGATNDQVNGIAFGRGQSVVLWDFDSGDSTGSTAAQSKAAYDNLIAGHPNTILALNHETYQSTADDVLPYAIGRLQAAGYNLVTVADCVGMAPYQSVQAPSAPDGSWVC